ncbi:MAG: hypothetical protein IAI50_19985 [Candidatus Eremiobacteraeota bacterium]|nr:hypothetical protein [Candidatus Eremiobacteraeota bacterium]
MVVVALNAGAASHIASCYAIERPIPLDAPKPLWFVEIEEAEATFASVLERVPETQPDVVVHRVVHPGLGTAIPDAAFVDEGVRNAIDDGRRFAPAHNALALEGLAAATKRFPNARQCVAFDRAFRSDAPRVATTFPGPRLWRELDLRRIGFHGISHYDAIERVAREVGRRDARVATIHLGSGCSISAFDGMRLIENTMGLTPLEGIVMGARGGSFDPGLLLFLLKSGRYTVATLEDALYHACGLKGVSDLSLDSRPVYAAADAGDVDARLALDLYCYRLRQGIGAIAATLGGLDAISWSGPVGEHMPRIRATVSGGLAFLGVGIDAARNAALPEQGTVPLTDITHVDASVRSFVVPTLEEWAMCRRAAALRDERG